MSDRLSGIAAFVQTVEAGSFALAAERLGLSRSAVGKSIARLEERLGVRLFHRTTRSQSLTEDGQAFYERCARAVAELKAAEAELDTGQRAPAGILRVSAPVLFGRHCVAPVLVDLARRHAALTLDLSFTDRQIDLVEEGIDLGVRIAPLADRAGLIARKLGTMRMVVVAAPSYLTARGVPRRLADLAEHDSVVYGRGGGSKPWTFIGSDGRETEIRVSSRIRFDNLEAIGDAAAAGAGLAFMACWMVADRLREGALVRVLEDEISAGLDVFAVWPQSRHLPTRVRIAIDELAARIPGLLEADDARSIAFR